MSGLGWVRNATMALIGAMVALAWGTLWWLERSPWGAWLHAHGHHHGAAPLGPLAEGALFVGGWLLMIVAMMLPATLPLTAIFRRLVLPRPDRATLVTLLVLGYLLVWGFFGLAVFGAHQLLRPAAAIIAPWAVSAGLFLLAGLFQFSSFKYRCLDRCRTPLAFVLGHWHRRSDAVGALRLGLHHGAFCVGCCWALMLLMFAVSTANLLWMLVLGLVMAAEKNFPGGRRLARPVGAALVLIGVALTVRGLTNSP